MKWGLGIGDWGLGIGDWGLGPIPNPHPHPHMYIYQIIKIIINNYNKLILIFSIY